MPVELEKDPVVQEEHVVDPAQSHVLDILEGGAKKGCCVGVHIARGPSCPAGSRC